MIKDLVFDVTVRAKRSEMNARTSRRLAINHSPVIAFVIDTCVGSIATLGTVDGRKVHARMYRGPVLFCLCHNCVLDTRDGSLFLMEVLSIWYQSTVDLQNEGP